MVTSPGCYIHPQRKMEMAQAHLHKAQGLISDLNFPIVSPLAKFIGLGKKHHHTKKHHAAGLYLNKR